MPYLSKKLLTEKLEAQVEAQRVELNILRHELRTVRAERDELKEQYTARWSELTTLHRIFDKLLLRLDKYEGVDIGRNERQRKADRRTEEKPTGLQA